MTLGLTTEILADVAEERLRQDQKWGEVRSNEALLWNAILNEEVGEVARALLYREPVADLKAELVQVAAVCVAWLEAIHNHGDSNAVRPYR